MLPEELHQFCVRLDRAGYRAEIYLGSNKLPKLKVRKYRSLEPQHTQIPQKKRAHA